MLCVSYQSTKSDRHTHAYKSCNATDVRSRVYVTNPTLAHPGKSFIPKPGRKTLELFEASSIKLTKLSAAV